MELGQLRYFVTVVEEGSFTKAARRLQMTQPPLSTAVAKLEREVGVALLVRDARGIRPTAAGARLAEDLRQALSAIEGAAVVAREIDAGEAGELRVGTISAAMWSLVPTALQSFELRHPAVAVTVLDGLAHEVIDWVRTARVDVGVVSCVSAEQIGATAAAGLSTRTLNRRPLMVVVPPDHRLAKASAIDLRDLANERWAVVASRSSFAGLEWLVHRAWETAGIAPRAQRVSAVGAMSLVRAGYVTIMAGGVVDWARDSAVFVPMVQKVPPIEQVAVWSGGEPRPTIAGFLEELYRASE